jgi:uncharacterized protein
MSDSHDCRQASRLPRLLMLATAWFARHPWLTLTCCAFTLAVSIHLARTRLTYRTQRDDLMSPDKVCQVRWRNYVREFGSDDDIVFVIEGSDHERMLQAVQRLGAQLRQEPTYFDHVFTHVDLRPLRNRALLFLTEAELRELNGRLQQMGPLLGPVAPLAWQGMTVDSLTARARSVLAKSGRGEKFDDEERAFLDQYQAIVAAAEQWLRDRPAYASPWKSFVASRSGQDDSMLEQPHWFFSDDGKLAFLLARPAKVDEKSFTPVAESVNRARELVREASAEFSDLSFGLTGLPVLENDEMAGTDRDSMWAARLALGGMVLLYFIVYRGPRYPLLTVSSLLAGTFWALGLTTIFIGHLNILSSAFAVMLIGMGDYGVFWVARFDEERRAGRDIDKAMLLTSAHAGRRILTAAITTSLAFFAIMFADFKAVAELGFIAGSGILLCACACFVLMPPLLKLTQREPRAGVVRFTPRPNRWLSRPANHPRLVLGVTAVVVLVCGACASKLRYDENLLHLQSQELESVRWEQKLLTGSVGTGWHAISVANSTEEAVALHKRYEQLPTVGRVDEIASLLPPDQDRKMAYIERIGRQMAALPAREQVQRHPQADGARLRGDLERTAKLAHQPELRQALEGLSGVLAELPAGARNAALAAFELRLTADLWDGLNRLRESATAKPIVLDDLPPDLRERYVSTSGKWLVRAFARNDLWDPDALAIFVEQTRTVDPEATGKLFGTLEGLRSMSNGYFHAGLYALLAIVLVLAVDFRSIRCVLLALLPLAIGMITSLGVLRLFGGSLNPANLVAVPLIVGVGVDNGVHVVHDYLARRRGEPYRISNATGRGILVAALTTIISFATLMISRHEGMFGLGLILSTGVACCRFAALFVLPAILRLYDRSRPQQLIEPDQAPLRRAA